MALNVNFHDVDKYYTSAVTPFGPGYFRDSASV